MANGNVLRGKQNNCTQFFSISGRMFFFLSIKSLFDNFVFTDFHDVDFAGFSNLHKQVNGQCTFESFCNPNHYTYSEMIVKY